MIVDWTEEFDHWFTSAEKEGGKRFIYATHLINVLMRLPCRPTVESPELVRVKQARRYELWRVAHRFDPEVAVRVICWFPSDQQVVVALVGFDKKQIGDVFYASGVARGEALVDAWIHRYGEKDSGG